MGAVFSGDVKVATKALTAIAYLNRGKSVADHFKRKCDMFLGEP